MTKDAKVHWHTWSVILSQSEGHKDDAALHIVARTYDEAITHALHISSVIGDNSTYVVSVERIADFLWFPPDFSLGD